MTVKTVEGLKQYAKGSLSDGEAQRLHHLASESTSRRDYLDRAALLGGKYDDKAAQFVGYYYPVAKEKPKKDKPACG